MPSTAPAGKVNWGDVKSTLVLGLLFAVAALLTFLAENLSPAIADLPEVVKLVIMGGITMLLKLVQRAIQDATGANIPPGVSVAIGMALVLLAGTLSAGEIVVDTGSAPGTFYLKVVVAADGSATVSPLKVVRLGTPSDPTQPTDPTDPNSPNPPGEPTAFQEEITKQTQQAITNGGSKATATRITAVYSLVASGVADESIALNKALDALRIGTDLALQGQPDAEKWKPWRESVGSAIAQLQQEGRFQTKAQYASALKEIERGMNAATGFTGSFQKIDPNAGILDNIDMVKLMNFIKLLLEILKALK